MHPKRFPDSKEFGVLVEQRRLAKHLDRKQLAEVMGVSANHIHQIERHGVVPSGINLPNIIRILEITPEEFVSSIGWWNGVDMVPPNKATRLAQLVTDLVREASA